jgi:hypothetical protein
MACSQYIRIFDENGGHLNKREKRGREKKGPLFLSEFTDI